MANADTTAKQLFSNLQDLVYQIRVIDIASGDKYSIGSGFQISKDGHIATNFHVVSAFVHEPKKYRLELKKSDGTTEPIVLLAVDVIHDLAIVFSVRSDEKFLALSTATLDKGNSLYSMGNPHDLGMTIIQGTYNGLIKNSRYQKILFSGSLNAGMSGGPALNEKGHVIGVNVSKGGEQLSFLVPVSHLSQLLQKARASVDKPDFKGKITRALIDDQDSFFTAILHNPTTLRPLGELQVLDKLTESLKCWGHTIDKEDIKYQAVHQHCKSEDEIYISNSLYVGEFFYQYEWITTKGLNQFQFYTFLESRFQYQALGSSYEKKDITEYSCHTDKVALSSGRWKVSSCLRAYKEHEGLYDVLMVMVSLKHKNKAAIVKMGASGISLDNSLALIDRMMGAVIWIP